MNHDNRPERGHSLASQFIVGIVLALIVSGLLAIWLIGSDTLRTMGLILVVAIALALVILASAFPIKAWRGPASPPIIERTHTIHEGTRTIERHTLDGRAIEAPKLYQLPGPASNAGAFPELLRAAYTAGSLAPRSTMTGPGAGQPSYRATELTPEHYDPDPGPGWDGDITA